MEVAQRAEVVAGEIGDLAVRRARLWVSIVRSGMDPSFQISEIRADAVSAALAFEEAGDVEAILDAYVVLIVIDLNAAHWREMAASARLGLELASITGRDRRRGDFVEWLSAAHVWGSTDATESIASSRACSDRPAGD